MFHTNASQGKIIKLREKKQLFIRHWKEIEKQSKQYYADVTLEATVSKRVSHKRLWWEIKCTFLCFFCFFCYLFKKKSDRSICLFLLRKAFFFSFKTMIRKNTARNARPFSKEREQFCFGRFAQLDIWKELVTAFCKSLFKSFCFCHHPECPSLSVTLSLKPMTFPPIPPFAGSP